MSSGFILGAIKLDKSIAFVEASIYWETAEVLDWGIIVELVDKVCWARTIGTWGICGGGFTTCLLLVKYNLTLPSGITSVT